MTDEEKKARMDKLKACGKDFLWGFGQGVVIAVVATAIVYGIEYLVRPEEA